MSDLISRQAAIKAIEDLPNCYNGFSDTYDKAHIIGVLEELPSAQRTGRWIWDDEGYHCSECWHHTYGNTGEVLSGVYKFCPNCGCAMKGEEE